MTQVPDEELKKAFADLHELSMFTRNQQKITDAYIESFRKAKQRAELTQIEMRTLPKKTKTFESIGRMFLLQDMEIIKENLKYRIKEADNKIKMLENVKSIAQQNLKSSEDNIREMVQKKQSQTAN